MKSISTVILAIIIKSLFACTRNNEPYNHTPIDSTYFNPSSYKLKSYAIANVANSNYSFKYDTIGRLISINHAADLHQYKCFFRGKVLYKMINQNPFTSADTIKYTYQQGLLSRIDIVPENNIPAEKLELVYDDLKRVTLINWLKVVNNGWITNRKLAFTYFKDNNISTYKNYYHNGTTLTLTDSTAYLGYDNKVNPKSNFFISDLLNDHFVYLPYLKLQINNPIDENKQIGNLSIITQHNYTYLENLPLNDNKTITVIPRTGAPYKFTGSELYEYY